MLDFRLRLLGHNRKNRAFPRSSHLKVAMSFTPFSALVDLQQAGWPAERVAAITAIAGPNNERIAHAALMRLELHDHIAGFGAWCDTQASIMRERP